MESHEEMIVRFGGLIFVFVLGMQSKSSGDKRGWSFRKKSGKQRGVMITSVAVSESSPASRSRETLESALLLKSPSPDNNNIVDEKQTFSVVDDEKKKKSQLPVVAYVAEPVDVNKATEVAVLVESKGTETEEDGLIGTELQSKLEGADASVIEKVEPDDVIIIKKEVDDSVVIIIQAAIRGFSVWILFPFFSYLFVQY